MAPWSTAHIPRRDRFEYWREERSKRIFGVEAEIDPAVRLAFTGSLTAAAIGQATLVEVDVSSYTMSRTQRAIDRKPDDSFYIRHCLRGGGLSMGGGTTIRVSGGAILTGASDTPFVHMPDPTVRDPNETVLYRALRIPFAMVPDLAELRVKADDRLFMRRHTGTTGLDVLLRSYLATFIEQAHHLAGAEADQAVRTLVQLAVASRDLGDPRSDTVAEAISNGLLERARRLIERDLHRADLTPGRVAAMLGVSVRKLHLVFEPSGESFSRQVLARRLARADRLLTQSGDMPVTEVAYASGFDSLSTFYRCYRAAFGASPSERRHAALQMPPTCAGSRPGDSLANTARV